MLKTTKTQVIRPVKVSINPKVLKGVYMELMIENNYHFEGIQ
jgi:hypothetical protein